MIFKYISNSCRSKRSLLGLQSRSWIRNSQYRSAATQVDLSGAKPYESIPGLSSLPIIGSLHHFLPIIGEIGPDAQFLTKLGNFRKKYGSIMNLKGVLGKADFVFLFEPDHYEQVYRAEDSTSMPSRPGFEVWSYYRQELRKDTFGGYHGLTTAEGSQWRDFRTKVNPAMLKPKLVKLYTPELSGIANDMVARLRKIKDDPNLDWKMNEEMTNWALESVAFVCLGARIGCLEENLTPDHPARQLVEGAKALVELTFKLEFMPSLWKIYPTKNYKKMIDVLDRQWNISAAYLAEAKKNIDERGHDIPEEDKSIIEKLLAIDEKTAIMMANEMLTAGIDTVAFTAINVMYHLAINPKVQDNLREEIRKGESARYLKACIKEAMRIYPVVPVILRRSTRDHVVGGYHIPVGVDVIAPTQYLSNLDEHYPRAKEFLPERWLVDKSDPLYHGNTHPMVSIPFGFGVRSCIGRRIADLETELFIKKLLDEFRVSWEGPPITVATTILNSFKSPIRFRFTDAK